MKKLLALLLVGCMALGIAACGNTTPDAPAGSSAATEAGGTLDTLAVCLASEPDTLDPALNSAVDGATMVAHLFSGLAKWAQDESGNLVIAPDCAEELVEGVVGDDGKVTYTYTLKEGLKWSDGQPLTAKDFEFAWKRAASTALGADYGYMFEVVDGYADDAINVTATDERTLVVVLSNAVSYWNELLAFPTYYPVREDVVANEAWATDPSTYVCNGAYTMTGWEHDSVITLTKNENYHDADAVTLLQLECYLSDDANNMLANFENGSWAMIDDVPTEEIANLEGKYPTEFVVAGQLGTYYVWWNVNEEILPATSTLTGAEKVAAEAEIRNAVGLLLDRTYICEEIGQAGQLPASSFVAMGLTDGDGSQFYENAGNNDFNGYYNVDPAAFEANYAAAIETLKKYYTWDEATQQFTDFPSMTYLYNEGDAHKAIGEYMQGAIGAIGIPMQLETQEWNTFLNTRKNGDYSIARNGWLADYNDPICFLDMWTSISGNNDIQFGKGAHADVAVYSLDLTPWGYDVKVENGTWAETYDVLISTIKSCTDNTVRYELMHYAEDILMATGCTTSLYYYTDIYMIDDEIQGFFSNPLGYKYFMYCTK